MAWRTWWNSLHYIRSRPTPVPNTSMYIFKMNFRPKPCNPPEQALRVGQMRKAEKRNLQCEGITTLFLPITLYKTYPGAGNLWIHLLKFAGAVEISQIFLGNKGNSRVQTSKVCVSCCQPRLSCPLLTCLWYSARYCLDDLYTHCCFFTIKMPSATTNSSYFTQVHCVWRLTISVFSPSINPVGLMPVDAPRNAVIAQSHYGFSEPAAGFVSARMKGDIFWEVHTWMRPVMLSPCT